MLERRDCSHRRDHRGDSSCGDDEGTSRVSRERQSLGTSQLLPTCRRCTIFQVLSRPFHGIDIDLPGLVRIPDEETVIAHHVHDARNPVRILRDAANRGWREWVPSVSAGNTEMVHDVLFDLLFGHGLQTAAKAYSLLQLAKLWQLQLRVQLGLAGQNDLQELPGIRLQVREESN